MSSLTGRFVILVLTLLVACAVTAWTGMRGLGVLDGELHAVVGGDMQRLLHVTDVRRLFRSMTVLERDLLLEPSASGKQAVGDKLGAVAKELLSEIEISERLALAEDVGKMRSLRAARASWVELNQRVQAASRSGLAEAQTLSAEHARDPVQWEKVIGQLVKTNEKRLEVKVAEADAVSSRARSVLLAAAILSGLIAVGAGTIIFRGIRRNMDEVVAVNSNLEALVGVRTRALEDREASIRLILDSTADGLFIVDLDGTVGPGRSKALRTWFGEEIANDTKAWDYLFPEDDAARAHFALSFEQIAEQMLPFEVCADQMPLRWARGDRVFDFSYQPIEKDGALAQVLVVVVDVTRKLDAERLERDAREVQTLVGHLLGDRAGFRVFVSDGAEHLRTIETSGDRRALMHCLHTLKGNAYVYGVSSVGDACHRLETAIVEGHLPSEEERAVPRARWAQVMEKVERLVGDGALQGMHVSDTQLADLTKQLHERVDHGEICRSVELWRAERTEAALTRLAAQTERVAKSLGRPVEVSVEDGGVRLLPGAFDAFWSTLIHVVRNAAYHGIEPIEERAAVGKPESGQITLAATLRTDGRLEVRIADDGRGLDVERIRKQAEARGLATGLDATELIFAEGLSTAEVVNDVAGRGVGLGVVATETSKLGGHVHVASVAGKGTEFRFSFPPRHVLG